MPAAERLKLDIEGVERQALVYPGKNSDSQPAPLVLVFHGRGDNMTDFARAVRLHKDWPEAIVVYPDGMARADESGMKGWLGSVQREDSNHDMLFTERLIAEASDRFQVDASRIYAGGFSNGGRFSFILLARKPEVFAAFVMIGALAPDLAGATTPRPVMYLFGKDEPAQYQEAWQQTAIALVALNRSSNEQREWAPEFIEFPATEGGAPTIINLYRAGHIWPHQGNRQIIRFFESHRLAGPGDTP